MTDPKDPRMEALAELRAAARNFEEVTAEQERGRQRLHDAIVATLRQGVGPIAIEKLVPYDRQHINRIRRAAGLPSRNARSQPDTE